MAAGVEEDVTAVALELRVLGHGVMMPGSMTPDKAGSGIPGSRAQLSARFAGPVRRRRLAQW
jgi:hypothetical protein